VNESAPAEMLRLFIALPAPEAVKAEIERAQTELKKASPDRGIRWTKREQFHVTLKFLGDVSASRVTTLNESVRSYCQKLPGLGLCAKGIGFFPSERKPRVIWAGTHDQAGLLPKLYEAIQVATCEFTAGTAAEKFTGHITLGRVKNLSQATGKKLRGLAAGMKERLFGEWTGEHVEIVQSELSSSGARYTVLAKIALGEESETI